MSDEIKEILDILAFTNEDIMWCDKITLNTKQSQLLLDYITNLQKTNKNHSKKLIELGDKITNLQQENERLQEDYSKAMKLIDKGVENSYKLLKDYKSRCEKANDKIQYIIDYGFDYDGFNTVESLKSLIDMLVDYARESKNILQNGSEDNG